jgi:hypothetical protein
MYILQAHHACVRRDTGDALDSDKIWHGTQIVP